MAYRWGHPVSQDIEDQVSVILDRLDPSFVVLSRAADRAESRGPYDWDHPVLAGFPEDSPYRWDWNFASSALLQVRRLCGRGDLDHALHLLLATGQFGHDLGENGLGATLIRARIILLESARECRNIVSHEKLNEAQLSKLAHGLEVLDRNFIRDGRSLRNALLAWGGELLRDEPIESNGYSSGQWIRANWRQGFSSRVLRADSFDLARGWARQYAQADALPYGEELKIRSAISAEANLAHNALACIIADSLGDCAQQRDWQTEVRIARMAVHYRRTEEILPLKDPWGGAFQVSEEGGTLRILWVIPAQGGSSYGYPYGINVTVSGPDR
jgi:hypothetical protein